MADDRQVDFGTFLRQAREQHGVSLQQLAITTKISARVLEALERNDPSKLPGGIFSRAFVRAYAREVGLDPDVVVASFVSAFPEEAGADEMPSATSAVEAESFEHGRRVVKVLLRVLGVALLLAVLALVYYSWLGRKPVGASSDAPPQAAAATEEVPAPPVEQPPAPGPGLTGSEQAQPAPPPAAQAAPLSAAPPPAAQATPSTDSAATSAARPADAAPQQAPLAVVLTLTDPCWISVSVDGTRAPSHTASAGERLEYTVRRSITMTVGNAGAVAVTLNGKPARALGAARQVVTTTINASAYESFLR